MKKNKKFIIDAEVDKIVLTDEEIAKRVEKTNAKMKELLSRKSGKKTPPSKETFEVMVKMLLDRPNSSKDEVDELSMKFYGKPYYKNQ